MVIYKSAQSLVALETINSIIIFILIIHGDRWRLMICYVGKSFNEEIDWTLGQLCNR